MEIVKDYELNHWLTLLRLGRGGYKITFMAIGTVLIICKSLDSKYAEMYTISWVYKKMLTSYKVLLTAFRDSLLDPF